MKNLLIRKALWFIVLLIIACFINKYISIWLSGVFGFFALVSWIIVFIYDLIKRIR